MKKLFTLLVLIATMATFAQAPQGFNYQAIVRNSAGALITNQIVGFKFSIKQTSASGTTVYSETQNVTPDNLGQVSLVVGTGTPSTGTFSTINWGSGSYYLGIELDSGTGYVAMGTTQLLSVPYALYANNAGSTSGSLQYPDGISNDTRLINSSSSFQVPLGKNFIVNYAQKGIIIDNISFDYAYPPVMIAGPGQTISTIDAAGFISGFLTNSGAIAITLDLTTGSYIVPAGKSFVLLAVNDYDGLLINNNDPNPNGFSGFPGDRQLLLGTGTILTCQCSINGYLK